MKFPPIAALAAALFFLFPGVAAAQEDPEAVYGKFHRALIAGNIDEMNKYGTPGGAAELAKIPPDQRKAVLELMKKLIPATYSITAKEPGADPNRLTMRATATIASPFDGKPQPTMGTILMVKIGGKWKVDESNWDSGKRGAKPPAAAATAPAPQPAKTTTTGPQKDAEAVLAKVHNAFKAANYDELKKYSTAYSMKELEKMDPEKRKGFLAFAYMLLPPVYTITGRELSPDGNRLTLRATGTLATPGVKPEQANGVIGMVKQDGAWKVDTEEWKNAGPAVDAGRPVQTPAPAPKAAAPVAPKRQAAAVKATTAPTPPAPAVVVAKEPCVYKPIMTDVDLERCR